MARTNASIKTDSFGADRLSAFLFGRFSKVYINHPGVFWLVPRV